MSESSRRVFGDAGPLTSLPVAVHRRVLDARRHARLVVVTAVDMPPQFRRVRVRAAAQRAHVLLAAGVARHVAAQVRRRREALAAHAAVQRVDAPMQVRVPLEPRVARERLSADRAAAVPRLPARATAAVERPAARLQASTDTFTRIVMATRRRRARRRVGRWLLRLTKSAGGGCACATSASSCN